MRGSYRCEKKTKNHSETDVSSVLNKKVSFLEMLDFRNITNFRNFAQTGPRSWKISRIFS